MKRRSVLVITALLVLLAPLAAWAADEARPHQVYFTRVAELSRQYGEYSSWPPAAKRAWIEARIAYAEDPRTYGEIGSEDIAAMRALLAPKNGAQGEAAIDRYLLEVYGDGKHLVTVNIHDCLEGHWGPEFEWGLPNRAWVSQLYLTYFPEQWDTMVYSEPSQDVVPPEKAVAIAQTALAEAWGLPETFDWSRLVLSYQYGVHRTRMKTDAPYYTVSYGTLCDDPERQPFSVLYECYVTGDGRVMSTADSAYTPSPGEQARAR